MARKSLRRRLVQGLLAYAVLVSIAIYAYGFVVNEQAERVLWTALLESEFDHILDYHQQRPDEHWADTETMHLYGDESSAPLPRVLRDVAPGLYDEVVFADKRWVVLVRDVEGQRWALALDIEDLERREVYVAASVIAAMVLMVAVLGLAIGWGMDRLMRPLRSFAASLVALNPERLGERIRLDENASTELAVIADALNDFIARHERHVERERAFIDSVSHELRTPIAVMAGAAELVGQQSGVPEATRQQLARIRRTGHDIERLIALLLVLAKDPARLARSNDRIALDQLLPEIVDDYRAMAASKGLRLVLEEVRACNIVAPLQVVQAAIGNLLRNAIENSDSGDVLIALDAGGSVRIDDPGRGMSPEEISRLYARMVRGDGREGGGIGLDLIARLCEHLGWQLKFESHRGDGTRTRLVFPPC